MKFTLARFQFYAILGGDLVLIIFSFGHFRFRSFSDSVVSVSVLYRDPKITRIGEYVTCYEICTTARI